MKRKPAPTQRPVHVSNRQTGLNVRATEIRRLIHTLDTSGLFSVPHGELSIALLSSREMGEVHGQFLHDPSPTDVITFEGDRMAESAGEICVCPEIAREFAVTHDKDFETELALYIVHGYLHLSGEDDTNPIAKRAMRIAERKAMRHLEAQGVLPSFRFDEV